MAENVEIVENKEPENAWEQAYKKYASLPLWETGAPGFEEGLGQNQPSIAMFTTPETKGKGCVLICAGGAYLGKAPHEGPEVARKLNTGGINAAVLDYRLIPYEKKYIVQDAQRAVRYLRYHAQELGIDAGRIAVMGFSAGGNLAAMVGFLGDEGNPDAVDPIDRCSSRVNAAVLCYAAVNLVDEYDAEDPEDYYYDFVIEQGMQFPPAFIWQSFGDQLVHFTSMFRFVEKLRGIAVPVELHMFPYGPHGQGLAPFYPEQNNDENRLTESWSDLCIRWLQYYGFKGEQHG